MKKYVLVLLAICWATPTWADLDGELGTIVVTASRMAQEQYEVASNVSVITQNQIENSGAKTIPDVLKQSLGVFITDKGTSKTSVIDMRGFGDTSTRNVLVLVNGRKLNTPDIAAPDLLQIPLGAVERIEIIRGAGSVLYGDNAVGGVVNIVTKEGKGDLQGAFGVSYGSYDKQSTDIELSGKTHDLSYYFYSNYNDDRGYREHSNVLAKDGNMRLGYTLSDVLKVDTEFGWHKDDYDLPGGLNASEIETLSRRVSTNLNDFAETKDQFGRVSFDFSPTWDDTYLGHIVLDLNVRDREVSDSFSGYNTLRSIRTKGLNLKYIFDREVMGHDVNFVTGIDYVDDENDIVGSGSNSDILTISKQELGFYGFAETELLDDLYLNVGLRYQEADYTFDQTAGFTTGFSEQNPDEWVHMGGLKYQYATGSSVFAQVQQTFRFLATDEWYSTFSGLNTDLEQQTGLQYELGWRHNFDNAYHLSITPYLMKLDNEIFFDPTNGFFGSNSNYSKTRRYGVEIGQRWDVLKFVDLDFLDGLEFFLNYNYQRPEFVDGGNDGRNIPMVPRHQTTHGFVAKFADLYALSLTGQYVGERYAINDTLNATDREEGYYVVDTKLAFNHNNWELYVGVNNIFNEKYSPYIVKSASSVVKDFFPAPERNYVAGVKVKF